MKSVVLKYAATIGMAGTIAVMAASPSLAHVRKHRSHDDSATAFPSATGYAHEPPLPGYIAAPNACVTDDGYGRYQPCDAGGGN